MQGARSRLALGVAMGILIYPRGRWLPQPANPPETPAGMALTRGGICLYQPYRASWCPYLTQLLSGSLCSCGRLKVPVKVLEESVSMSMAAEPAAAGPEGARRHSWQCVREGGGQGCREAGLQKHRLHLKRLQAAKWRRCGRPSPRQGGPLGNSRRLVPRAEPRRAPSTNRAGQ